MKAGLVTGLRRFELVEVPEPVARPGIAVAAIALCGICGTDVHGFASADPYNPAICGHEWVGTVIATGDGVSNVAEGDRVVPSSAPACGECPECRAGRPDYCAPAFLGVVGPRRDGAAPRGVRGAAGPRRPAPGPRASGADRRPGCGGRADDGRASRGPAHAAEGGRDRRRPGVRPDRPADPAVRPGRGRGARDRGRARRRPARCRGPSERTRRSRRRRRRRHWAARPPTWSTSAPARHRPSRLRSTSSAAAAGSTWWASPGPPRSSPGRGP